MTVLVSAFVAFTAVPAFAQTTASSSATSTQTTSLDSAAQIAQLEAEIAQLQAQLQAVTQTLQTLQLSTPLHQGMTGEDVKKLQEILATDPNLFSNTNVTGFYGPLTTKAVESFQSHFGLATVGAVGPLTLEKLNELLKEHNATSTSNLSENELGDLGENGVSVSTTTISTTSHESSDSNSQDSQHSSDSSHNSGCDN